MPAKSQRRRPGFFGDEARSESSSTGVSLSNFIGPRYWRSWLLVGWLRVTALLPRRFSLSLHKKLGRWLGSKSRSSSRLVDDNLARCFPELTDVERGELASEFFANLGAIVAELAMAWFGSQRAINRLFEVEGSEHLDRALSKGRGVILATGHFTPIEICSVGVRAYAPRYTVVYNQRRSRLLSEIQRRCRERLADNSLTKRDIRGLLRSLGENAAVWFSADEAHTGKSSALLPFFGEPALTNTSLSRIAKISGAAVVPVFYCRKDDDSGYRIRFEPALEGFPSDDAIEDTRRLIAVLEQQILECPTQYFWKQKRFRHRRLAAPA